MEDNNIEIILIGQTGVGKSSLGNFLLGKKVFDESYSRTENIELKNFNGLTIIDTPGFNNSYDDDNNKVIENIVKYIKNMKRLRAILFLINSQDKRLTNDLQNSIKMLCNAFDDRRIVKNMSFVFTRCYGRESQKKIIKENSVILVDKIKNIIANFYGKYNDQYSFKSFFVDSDLDDPDDDSLIERKNIFNWAKELPFINTPLIRDKDIKFKRIYEEHVVESSTSEDYNYKYLKRYFYVIKRGIDINDKEVIIEPKRLINTEINRIPKNNGCSII